MHHKIKKNHLAVSWFLPNEPPFLIMPTCPVLDVFAPALCVYALVCAVITGDEWMISLWAEFRNWWEGLVVALEGLWLGVVDLSGAGGLALWEGLCTG